MIVAVASGKGGTGKTTVSASLARVWNGPVAAVDLDVEEPNLHLFLHPELTAVEKVHLEVPVADPSRCTLCRACAELCQFKAISVMGKKLLVFPEMCHGCGGCLEVCPEGALAPGTRELGEILGGTAGNAHFLMGRLRVGEAMTPPLLRAVKERLGELLARTGADAILDAPPGVSCPAVNAVRDADAIVLVVEPTPFGFHDFRLAVEAFSPFGKPLGVVVNRVDIGDAAVAAFCRDHHLPVLARIPYDLTIARGYAQGRVAADLNPGLRELFTGLAASVRALADRLLPSGLTGEVAHA